MLITVFRRAIEVKIVPSISSIYNFPFRELLASSIIVSLKNSLKVAVWLIPKRIKKRKSRTIPL
jgi:hypothetical protein